MAMALEHIRVLDLSRLLPGPYCSMLLADFGAEVIKVEEPLTGDYARWDEPKAGEYSAMFESLNRNKKSVALNLKDDNDHRRFIELAKTADVLIESFRPGVMDRLGIGYESLKEINPGLVYCAISGYGQTGPYREKAGHDINYISYAGLMHFQGTKGDKPTVPATQIADVGGGALMALSGILMALIHRDRSGKGQFVDISMTDGVVSWLQSILPGFLAGGNPQPGELIASGGQACYEVYSTSDGRYISVGAIEAKFWKEFCDGIGRPDLVPLHHAPYSVQCQLKKEIEEIVSQKTLAYWLEVFENKRACVSPVLTLEEMADHPQIRAREMVVEQGSVKQIGIPIKLYDTPGQIRFRAPKLGEHNGELL